MKYVKNSDKSASNAGNKQFSDFTTKTSLATGDIFVGYVAGGADNFQITLANLISSLALTSSNISDFSAAVTAVVTAYVNSIKNVANGIVAYDESSNVAMPSNLAITGSLSVANSSVFKNAATFQSPSDANSVFQIVFDSSNSLQLNCSEINQHWSPVTLNCSAFTVNYNSSSNFFTVNDSGVQQYISQAQPAISANNLGGFWADSSQNVYLAYKDNAGTAHNVLLNTGGGGSSGITSFNSRTNPAAVLQLSDITALIGSANTANGYAAYAATSALNLPGALNVGGNKINLGGSASNYLQYNSSNANVNLSGASGVQIGALIAGNFRVGYSCDANANSTLGATLTVPGQTILQSSLNVSGVSTLASLSCGNTSISGTLNVTAAVYLGATTINGQLVVSVDDSAGAQFIIQKNSDPNAQLVFDISDSNGHCVITAIEQGGNYKPTDIYAGQLNIFSSVTASGLLTASAGISSTDITLSNITGSNKSVASFINNYSPGTGGLTSFNGRTTPAAVLQLSDISNLIGSKDASGGYVGIDGTGNVRMTGIVNMPGSAVNINGTTTLIGPVFQSAQASITSTGSSRSFCVSVNETAQQMTFNYRNSTNTADIPFIIGTSISLISFNGRTTPAAVLQLSDITALIGSANVANGYAAYDINGNLTLPGSLTSGPISTSAVSTQQIQMSGYLPGSFMRNTSAPANQQSWGWVVDTSGKFTFNAYENGNANPKAMFTATTTYGGSAGSLAISAINRYGGSASFDVVSDERVKDIRENRAPLDSLNAILQLKSMFTFNYKEKFREHLGVDENEKFGFKAADILAHDDYKNCVTQQPGMRAENDIDYVDDVNQILGFNPHKMIFDSINAHITHDERYKELKADILKLQNYSRAA